MNQTINGGIRKYEIHHFTGRVAGASKNLETKISGSGSSTAYSHNLKINSTTVVHDNLFLVDSNGFEMALQLQGFDLACRDGNTVTASWATQVGGNSGPFFIVTNHSTNQQFINNNVLKRILTFGTTSSVKSIRRGLLFVLIVLGSSLILIDSLFLFGVMFSLLLASVYYSFIVLPGWVKKFKSSVQYPQPQINKANQ